MDRTEKPSLHIGPGQVRINRMPGIKSARVAESIKTALGKLQGVENILINGSSGSILINHDKDRITPGQILESVRQLRTAENLEFTSKSISKSAGISELEDDPEVMRMLSVAGFKVASSLFTPAVAFGLFMPLPKTEEPAGVKGERLRIRLNAIKRNPALAREIKNALKKQGGIIQVTARPLTGALIILYDREIADIEGIIKIIEEKGHQCHVITETQASDHQPENYPPGAGRIIQKIIGKTARKTAREAVNRLFENSGRQNQGSSKSY